MATTVATFGGDETSMRFEQPLLTEGLNRKMAVHTAPGIYQGFRLSTSGSALSVTISGSRNFAVYESLEGFSLSISRSGSFSINLSSVASKTVVIALFASYQIGTPTVAEIRAYEIFPSDTLTLAPESLELIILGTVIVPASGTIPEANITHDGRRPAWATTAPEAVPWTPVVRNSSFEYGVNGSNAKFAISDWINRTDLAVNGSFRLGTTTSLAGSRSLEFNKLSGSTSTGRLEQLVEVSVTPSQLVRVVVYTRQLLTVISGTYSIKLQWGDSNSTASASTSIVTSIPSAELTFRGVERTLAVPTAAFVLKAVSVEVTNLVSTTSGVSVVFDDLQVFLENNSALTAPATYSEHLRQPVVSSLVIEDPLTYAIAQLAALLRFDKSFSPEGKLVLDRKDQDYSGGNIGPSLELLGRLFLAKDATLQGDTKVGEILTFTSFTFTADSSTDTMTASGPLPVIENDGPVNVSSTGTLPGNLFPGVPFYINKLSSTTFKLRPFRGATTVIDITSNGTGVHTLSANADTRRSKLLRADGAAEVDGPLNVFGNVGILNNLLVEGSETVSGDLTVSGVEHYSSRSAGISAAGFEPAGANSVFEPFSATNTYLQTWRFGSGGNLIAAAEKLRFGDIITRVQVNVATAGGATLPVALSVVMDSGTASSVSTSLGSSVGISLDRQSFSVNTAVTVTGAPSIRVTCNDGSNNMHLISAEYDWFRP